MADYNINAVTRRVVYTGSAGLGPYAFTFEILDQNDIAVYFNTTKLTLTTDYTVTINANGTGSITIVTGSGVPSTPTASDTITIVGARDIERTTDFVTAGDLRAAALNEQLDGLTIFDQQLAEENKRTLKAPVTDPAHVDEGGTLDMTLPSKTARAGKYLQFNSTTGNPEAGPDSTDVTTLADIATDIATLADIEDGTDATDAIQTVAGISSNVTTVAGIASNVSTVAGISSAVSSVAADATDIGTVATNIASVNTVAGISSNVTTTAGIAANITTVAGIASDVTAVVADATDIGTVATNISNVNTVAGQTTNLQNVTDNLTAIQNASSNAASAASSASAAAASAASAATAYDSFDDRYLGVKASDPALDNDGNALVSGALYFSSSENIMKVYDGASWIAATSAGNVSLILYEYTATSGQTTFSGADDNAATLSYTVNNIQVVMNGVILDPSDYTATNGTSVVLASGAAAGDLINIYAFQSFTVADTVSASAGGTFSANVAINGDLTVDTNTLYVDSTNNRVGIGTTSPSLPLHINGSSAGDGIVYSRSGTEYFRIDDTGTDMNIKTTGGGHAITFNTSGSEAMRIDSSGNVGIGTSSPGSYYATGLVVDGTSSNGITISSGTSDVVGLYFADGTSGDDRYRGYVQYEHANNGLLLGTNATERMRIDSSGNLLVGMTSPINIYNLTNIQATNAKNGLGISTSSSSGTSYFAAFYVGTTQIGSIHTSDHSTVSYSSTSDYRLKENVTEVTGAADRVKALNPVRFNFIASPDKTVDGFLAHEVQDIVPEAITGTKDAVDDEGNPVYQGIDQSKLVPLLTAALQEALTKIDDLESRLSALETAQ